MGANVNRMRGLLTQRIGPLGLIVLLHAALFWVLGNRVPRTALPLATAPHEVSARLIVPAPAAPAAPKPAPPAAAHSAPAVERPVRDRRPKPSPPPHRKAKPVATHAPAPPQPAPAAAPPAPPVAHPAPTLQQSAPARVSAASQAPAAPEAPAPPKTISGVEYLQPPRPVYPPLSRRLGEQGKAILRVLIDIHGHAQAIELKQSSGFERLDEAARDAVRHALFRPTLEDGKPVPVFALIPITFQLDF